MGLGLSWLLFALSALIIVIAGYRMTIYGDIIGDRSSLGHSWVGTILLASVTSLPELVTAFTVSTIGDADIVVGNIFGSNIFNMLIVFVFDLLIIYSVFTKVQESHKYSGYFAIGISSIVLTSLSIQAIVGRENLGWYGELPIGIDSILIIGAYIYAMIFVYKKSTPTLPDVDFLKEKDYDKISSRVAYMRYLFYATIIIASGIFMGIQGVKLADEPINIFGAKLILGGTLMGTIFFAIVTSLPELVVSISSVRLGSPDMALGNVMGSNLFNLVIIGVADFPFSGGPILTDCEYNQSITVFLSMFMIGIVVLAIKYRAEKTIFKRLSIPGILLLVTYIIGITLLSMLNLVSI